MMRPQRNAIAGLALLFATMLPLQAQPQQATEVDVASVLPAELRATVGGILQPTASVDGARVTYTLNGPDGPSRVTGTVSMLERVNEIRAVATLEAMKKTDVYTEALKRSATSPVRYGKAVVDAPVETVSNTVRGLGGFIADVGYSLVSDDPSQENVAKTGLGFATAKRSFAFQLGVNPYTEYQPLQDAIGEVAWTAVGGSMTVGAAFRAVRNAPGDVLSLTRTANSGREMVRDLSPRELQNRNEESLRAMGASADLTESLLNNFSFDPEAETRLVTALKAMDGVAGRPDFVALASLAENRDRADLMRDWAELMAVYHSDLTPARRVIIVASAPFLIDAEGGAHALFPTDYVTDTPGIEDQIEAFSGALRDGGHALVSILMTGPVDPAVAELLDDQGWQQVRANAETILRN